MKRLWIPLVALLGCASTPQTTASSAQAATTASPELEQLARQLEGAWNAHDPAAWAPLLVENSTLVDPMGGRSDGKQAILDGVAQPGPTKQTSLKLEIEAVQWLSESTVLIDAIQTLSGPGVEKIGRADGRLVAVAQLQDGEWRVVASRPYVTMQRGGGQR